MPINLKGERILNAMKKFYGKRAGKKVFYASENAGKIKGVTKKK